jgi:hypothetical protein
MFNSISRSVSSNQDAKANPLGSIAAKAPSLMQGANEKTVTTQKERKLPPQAYGLIVRQLASRGVAISRMNFPDLRNLAAVDPVNAPKHIRESLIKQ